MLAFNINNRLVYSAILFCFVSICTVDVCAYTKSELLS